MHKTGSRDYGLIDGDSFFDWKMDFIRRHLNPQKVYREVKDILDMNVFPGDLWDALGMWSLVMVSDYKNYKTEFAKMTPRIKRATHDLLKNPWMDEWKDPKKAKQSLLPLLRGQPGLLFRGKINMTADANRIMSEMFNWFGPQKRVSLLEAHKLDKFAKANRKWIIFLYKPKLGEYWQLEGKSPTTPVTLTTGVYGQSKKKKTIFLKATKGITPVPHQHGHQPHWEHVEHQAWEDTIRDAIQTKLKRERYIYA